jgi:multidrug transporter EmrE-like cation transporter
MKNMLISGILLGLGAFILKIGFSNENLLLSFFSPPTILGAVILLAGFMLMQKSMHDSNVSVVAPVSMGLSIAIPTFLSFFLAGDYVSLLKWFGIIFILLGVLLMPS